MRRLRCAPINVLPIGREAALRAVELTARIDVNRFTPVTTAGAAKRLGVTIGTIRMLCQRHKLQYLSEAPVGYHRYLALEQVLEYDAERRRLGYRK